jgi:CubicO group peptidase (beta-lactamase class C family)
MQSFEEFLLSKMSESRLPSIAVSLVRGSDVVYAKAFGFRDLENGLPATPRTIYGIGSITKMFTAIAIMQLQERGLLSIDDLVSKYGFDLKVMGEPVRVWHLLSHTSGIPALGYAEAFIDGITGARRIWLPLATPEDVLTFMRGSETWAVDKPGRRMFYLNEGYVILGKIIEEVSGVSYWDYIRQNILKPLSMGRTYLRREEAEGDSDVATPYIITNKGPIRSRFPYGIASDGGLLSNALDLSKFLLMLINRGSLSQALIITKDSLKAMENPITTWGQYYVTGDEYAGYGLGVITYRFFDTRVLGHSGSVGVYTAFLGYIPEERVGVVLLANGSGYPMIYLGLYLLAVTTNRSPDKLPFIKYERLLRNIEGAYESWRGAYRVYVKVKNWVPYIVERSKYGKMETPLFPLSISDDEATFVALTYGRKSTVTITLNPPTLIYERFKFIK